MTCPTNKIPYRDELHAWKAAIKLWDVSEHMNKSVYLCKCGSYHLSSRKGDVPDWVIRIRNKIASSKLKAKRKKKYSKSVLPEVPREIRKKRAKILKGQLTLEEQKKALNMLNN